MKKSQEIIGLPVFSILDGAKIGQVKDLVINPEEGRVEFILVSQGNWYTGARILPFKDVMGIGEHAITTECETMLASINDVGNASSLLDRNIEVKGNRVLTNKGNLVGIISEYEIDENTGKISRLEYKTAQDESKTEIIAADDVMTYGREVIVVKEKSGNLEHMKKMHIEETAPEMQQSEGASFFKERQKQFLLGKKVVKDIKDQAGNLLIAQGSIIDEETINLAEKNNKFIELSEYAK